MNPSRKPYLNDASMNPPKGYSGMILIRPVGSAGGGSGEIQGFSSYSGYSAGNKYVSPGVTLTSRSTDEDKNISPDTSWNYYNLSPISYGVNYAFKYGCSSCSGDIYNPCIGIPGCLQPQYNSGTWSAEDVTSIYYGASGVSLQTSPINGSSTITISSKDMCPRSYPGSAYFNMSATIQMTHEHVQSFGGSITGVSTEELYYAYSGISETEYTTSDIISPIQLPYVDVETKNGLETGQIPLTKSFSGSSMCSGFSGFSGASGFSASTGCSGL